MLPGPTIIKRCSDCSQLIEQSTLDSGNTLGAKFWTDGKRYFPMLPDNPWLVECPHCQAFLFNKFPALPGSGDVVSDGCDLIILSDYYLT